MEYDSTVVKEVKTGIIKEVKSLQTPRANEPGITLVVKINHFGVAEKQEQGFVKETLDNHSFAKYIAKLMNISEKGIGNLGNLKENPEDWLVATKKAENESDAVPKKPIEVVTDKTNPVEVEVIALIQALTEVQAVPDDKIMKDLTEQFGEKRAKEYMDKAYPQVKGIVSTPVVGLNTDDF